MQGRSNPEAGVLGRLSSTTSSPDRSAEQALVGAAPGVARAVSVSQDGTCVAGRQLSVRGWRHVSRYATATAVVAAVIVWQIVSNLHVFPPIALPSPIAVLRALMLLATQGYGGHLLTDDIWVSLLRILIGFVGAVVVGVPIGLMMARIDVVFRVIDPFLQFIRPVPPLAYIPLLVVWFGIGELPKIMLILIGTIPVIIIGTISGVRGTPPLRLAVARTLGASEGQIFRHVILPSSLPEIFTAMRIGIGVAWTCLVAAELIAADQGLGWLVQYAGQALQVPIVIVGIIVIGILGYAMELVIRIIERRAVPWRGHG